jgi:hypothetical protein
MPADSVLPQVQFMGNEQVAKLLIPSGSFLDDAPTANWEGSDRPTGLNFRFGQRSTRRFPEPPLILGSWGMGRVGM